MFQIELHITEFMTGVCGGTCMYRHLRVDDSCGWSFVFSPQPYLSSPLNCGQEFATNTLTEPHRSTTHHFAVLNLLRAGPFAPKVLLASDDIVSVDGPTGAACSTCMELGALDDELSAGGAI